MYQKEETITSEIDNIFELLDQMRDRLYEKAKFCADNFWEHHLQLDDVRGANKPSSLGCRVRQKGTGIYAEWYYNTWRKKIDGSCQPYSHHICKSARGFHYDLRKLYAHAPTWEHSVIRETESAFANLRQQNSQLTAMRRNLQALSKLESDWQEFVREAGGDGLQDF